MSNFIYSNPTADAADAFGGAANTLGSTILRAAMLRQSQAQSQQEMMMRVQQLQEQQRQFNAKQDIDQQSLDVTKSHYASEDEARKKAAEGLAEERTTTGEERKKRGVLYDAQAQATQNKNKLYDQVLRQMNPSSVKQDMSPTPDVFRQSFQDQGGQVPGQPQFQLPPEMMQALAFHLLTGGNPPASRETALHNVGPQQIAVNPQGAPVFTNTLSRPFPPTTVGQGAQALNASIKSGDTNLQAQATAGLTALLQNRVKSTGGQSPGQLASPKSEDEYNALPSGARYQHPDGTIKIKP